MTEVNPDTLHTMETASMGASRPQPALEEGASTDQSTLGAEHAGSSQTAEPLHSTAIDTNPLPAGDQNAPSGAALDYYATPQQDYPGVNSLAEPAFAQVFSKSAGAFIRDMRRDRCQDKVTFRCKSIIWGRGLAILLILHLVNLIAYGIVLSAIRRWNLHSFKV